MALVFTSAAEYRRSKGTRKGRGTPRPPISSTRQKLTPNQIALAGLSKQLEKWGESAENRRRLVERVASLDLEQLRFMNMSLLAAAVVYNYNDRHQVGGQFGPENFTPEDYDFYINALLRNHYRSETDEEDPSLRVVRLRLAHSLLRYIFLLREAEGRKDSVPRKRCLPPPGGLGFSFSSSSPSPSSPSSSASSIPPGAEQRRPRRPKSPR